MPALDSEALDFRAASESFKPTRTLRKRDLESLRLLTTYEGHTAPTFGGLLLFGRDRERHFPDAWITIVADLRQPLLVRTVLRKVVVVPMNFYACGSQNSRKLTAKVAIGEELTGQAARSRSTAAETSASLIS